MTTAFVYEAHPDDLAELANGALHLWDLPVDAAAYLINLSENATFLVEAGSGYRRILRVHRAGYNSSIAINSELAWMAALQTDAGIDTPVPVAGRNGALVQQRGTLQIAPRQMVMFEWLAGVEPDPDDDLVKPFHQLGSD